MFNWIPFEYEWYDSFENKEHDDIDKAFWICTHRHYKEKKKFIQKWGGSDFKTCMHVIAQEKEEDRYFALCIIAWIYPDQAIEILVPFLKSANPKERWISALCLGELGEDCSVSPLCHMLTEFLPYKDQPWPLGEKNQCWFEERRPWIARTLRNWKHSSVSVALRAALIKQVEVEPYFPFGEQICGFYENVLAYELGYRGVVGALTGLSWSQPHIRLALVHMLVGWYEAHSISEDAEQDEPLFAKVFKPSVRSAIITIAMDQWGFSEQEVLICLDSVYDDEALRLEIAGMDESGKPKRPVNKDWLDDVDDVIF